MIVFSFFRVPVPFRPHEHIVASRVNSPLCDSDWTRLDVCVFGNGVGNEPATEFILRKYANCVLYVV